MIRNKSLFASCLALLAIMLTAGPSRAGDGGGGDGGVGDPTTGNCNTYNIPLGYTTWSSNTCELQATGDGYICVGANSNFKSSLGSQCGSSSTPTGANCIGVSGIPVPIYEQDADCVPGFFLGQIVSCSAGSSYGSWYDTGETSSVNSCQCSACTY